VPTREWAGRRRGSVLARIRLLALGPDLVTASPSPGVSDAAGLDVSSVDRGLLVSFADARQVGEEVRPGVDRPGVESCAKRAEDISPGVQAFGFGPGLDVGVPRLA
jgi:hypothetical protein